MHIIPVWGRGLFGLCKEVFASKSETQGGFYVDVVGVQVIQCRRSTEIINSEL